MAAPALSIQGLSKRYVLGSDTALANNLRELVMDRLVAPLRWLRGGSAGAARREEFWALKDVSFEVPQGRLLGIVGANGAGKSTLLKIISRVTRPTEGRVELRGRVASLLEVGTGFHPELTGRENVYLNGTLLGMTRAEVARKFDSIVEFAEVERFIDTPVKRYSSGMYVRLAFAVAAHLEPEILVIDEVLAVGDARFQRKCLGKLGEVAGEGRTILFVSHNMAAIQRLCTEVIVLEAGRVKDRGDPVATVARYLDTGAETRYQARAVGDGPQFLSARLEDDRGEPVNRLVCKANATMRLRYRLTEHVPGLRVGIGVLGGEGLPVFTTNTGDADLELPRTPGEHTALVRIPADTFLAGEFQVALCLWSSVRVFDLQEPAFAFSVDPGDSVLYRETAARKGFVHVPCQWTLGEVAP